MSLKLSKNPAEKLILALDAFSFDADVMRRVAGGLRSLFGLRRPEIRSVFVLTPEATLTPFSWFDEKANFLKEGAYSALTQGLQDSDFVFSEPAILIDTFGSPGAIGDRLHDFALHDCANLIVVPTTGKKTVSRFLLGSVSDNLLRKSKLPLLTIPPAFDSERGLSRRCLFAADFLSEKADRIVDRVLRQALLYDFEVLFLHIVDARGGGSWLKNASNPLPLRAVRMQNKALRKLESLVERANQQGCRAYSQVNVSFRPIPLTLLEVAQQENIDFIALSAEGWSCCSLLKSAMARSILQKSVLPVWTPGTIGPEESSQVQLQSLEL